MYSVKLDEQNYFTGSYAKVGSISGGVKVDSLPANIGHPTCHKLVQTENEHGTTTSWEYDAEKYERMMAIANKDNIRIAREEAFVAIDKYQLALVYADLTAEQQAELKVYRQAWLDAPETGLMPQPLSWMI